jgi:hypothetical protein
VPNHDGETGPLVRVRLKHETPKALSKRCKRCGFDEDREHLMWVDPSPVVLSLPPCPLCRTRLISLPVLAEEWREEAG